MAQRKQLEIPRKFAAHGTLVTLVRGYPKFSAQFLPFLATWPVAYECRSLRHRGEEDIRVEELIEAQRKLSVSQNPLERIMGSLCVAARLKKRLAVLPDRAIGRLMFGQVWDDIDLLSPEMTICQEATERLLEHELGGRMITAVWERTLYIGSLKDAERLASANPLKIASVLSLCPEEIERKSQSIDYMRVAVTDAQPISTQQFEEVMAAIERGLWRGNLLLHCAAGYSRSPIVAAAWMHKRGYLNFEAALEKIGRLRPTVDPSPVLLKSIEEELSRCR